MSSQKIFVFLLCCLFPFYAQAFNCPEKMYTYYFAPEGTHYQYGNRVNGATGGSYVCQFTPQPGEIYSVQGRFELNAFQRETDQYTRYGLLQIRRADSNAELGFRVLKTADVYDGNTVSLTFIGDGRPVYVSWHSWNSFSAFHIAAESIRRETNLRVIDVGLNSTGDIIYEAEIHGNIPVSNQRPMCVDFYYASNNVRTRRVYTQCLHQCNNRTSCRKRSVVPRSSRVLPMMREENQILAIIESDGHYPESTYHDNGVVFTFNDFTVEQMPTILTNKGWLHAASVQRVWQSRREHIINPEGTTPFHFEGLDFTGGNANIVTGIFTIDWLIANAPAGTRIRKRIKELRNPKLYREREARQRIRDNLQRIKDNSRRKDLLPISHIYTLGQELVRQRVLGVASGHGNFINDLYATVGVFPMYGIPVGYAERVRKGIYKVTITEIAVVAFDSFDFFGTQLGGLGLGCWGLPDRGPLPGLSRECVFNEDYRNYRTLKGVGGDFINQSDSRRFPLEKNITFKVRLR